MSIVTSLDVRAGLLERIASINVAKGTTRPESALEAFKEKIAAAFINVQRRGMRRCEMSRKCHNRIAKCLLAHWTMIQLLLEVKKGFF